jgi:transcriptional regulator with XRE-family HTH domain
MKLMAKIDKVTHPDFAVRMAQACDGNPDVPPPNYGRLGWFVAQIEKKSGQVVTQETVRKWFAGEARPRFKTLSTLAQVLKVDEAWLSIGKSPDLNEKQKRVRNASADGAVNVVAGFVGMCGAHPAFPRDDDVRAAQEKIDLYAIIKGAQYAFHVVTGRLAGEDWTVSVPVEARATILIAVLLVGPLQCEFFELDWEQVEVQGKRKGGTFEVEKSNGWKQIRTFAERL